MKNILSFALVAGFVSFFPAAPASALPEGYCQVGCTGIPATPAFDFAKKFKEAGDPNGGPGKETTLIPDDEGGAPSKSAKTSDVVGNLSSLEGWSAGSCGKSLNDDSWNTIEVVAPCPGSRSIYDRQKMGIVAGHKKDGVAPPSKKIGNDFYEGAKSDAAQKNLEDKWYCRMFKKDPSETALSNSECKPWDMMLGKTNLVAAGMHSQACRSVSAPAFVPEVKTPMGGGWLGCRKGLPPGSSASASAEFNIGAWVLGKSFPLFATTTAQTAPYKKAVTHVSSNSFMGTTLCPKNQTAKDVAYDENCPAYKLHAGTSATFTVGPIPITVEAGAEGQLGVVHFSRVTPMWANGRADPYIQVTGYAAAYVNLIIAKGGVEADLIILHNVFDLYGFGGVAWLPSGPSNNEGFHFSEQLSGYDKLTALKGSIAAFAKIPVPKFIGWKWKKYRYTIFSWDGLSADGYVFNQISGPSNIATVKNN